jgi:hypothetical protein
MYHNSKRQWLQHQDKEEAIPEERGGGSLSNRQNKPTDKNDERSQQTLSTTKTKATDGTKSTTAPQVTSVDSPTISDLTEETWQAPQEMDTEEDILAPISLSNVPKQLEKFIPNIQWTRDLEKDLPKKRYGIEIKIAPETTPKETEQAPQYSQVRIFNAIAMAILMAAPGTVICSIDNNEEAIVNLEDIPTSQNMVNHYLESPIVNNKTYTYHARIHISCIKPLFITMKNDKLMKWLQKNRIFIEENDLETTLPSTVGVLFFVHPRPSLFEVYHEQLRANFVGNTIPDFKIRRFKVKSGEQSAYVILIQTVKDKAQEVGRQFKEVNDKNPYEFVSWRAWLNLHPLNKVATIKAHNYYLQNVQILYLPGFCDDNTTLMGKVNHKLSVNDYSELTLNEFILSHYHITDSIPMFRAVLGPYLGRRLFVLPIKLSSAGSRLLETLTADILRFMTPAAGTVTLSNYPEMAQKMENVNPWKPTWFEQQILTMKQEEKTEEHQTGKSKKITETKPKDKPEPSITHHSHIQNATKVLSDRAPTDDFKSID